MRPPYRGIESGELRTLDVGAAVRHGIGMAESYQRAHVHRIGPEARLDDVAQLRLRRRRGVLSGRLAGGLRLIGRR
ncbi:MAG: hypothetical protein ACRDL2_10730 [Gaiellaceae bacterium]